MSHNISGFDVAGLHRNGGRFNEKYIDFYGYDELGFCKHGIHKVTKTKFDECGFDKYENDKDGRSR
jgi:hypothetical protein